MVWMESIASKGQQSLWIFGYGSLIWNPGFEYVESRRAYACGWKRRMYQGNTYHRGDEVLPGRVATLIESRRSAANGVVFRVEGSAAIEAAIMHLNEREVGNGYIFKIVRISLFEDSQDKENSIEYPSSILALTCIAPAANEFYLGPQTMSTMASQIGSARGKAGPNHEYVLKLAENIRALFPEDEDRHLYGLERRVRDVIRVAA